MAMYRIDGWDYWPSGSSSIGVNAMADGWSGSVNNMQTLTGRFGTGNSVGIFGGTFGGTLYQALGRRFTTETVVMGQGWYMNQTGLMNVQIGVYDGQGGGILHWLVSFEQDGCIRLYRVTTGTSTVVVATTPAKTIHTQEWNYIEIKSLVSSTTGLVEVRVNKVVVLSYSGNTQSNTAAILGLSPGWDTWYCSIGGQQFPVWDDRYILDTSGANNNDYLGNVRVNLQLPSAPGDVTGMSAFGAASNWQAVGGSLLTDVEYVYSPTMGAQDLYTMNPNVSAQNIFAVQAVGAHRQDDSTQLKSNLLLKTGGVIYNGSDHELAQTYHYYRDLWELNPHTGVGWTAADLNALQAGQEVLAG